MERRGARGAGGIQWKMNAEGAKGSEVRRGSGEEQDSEKEREWEWDLE